MSQDLFEINRANLKKIFESHQIRGSILFTDVLKICTATRIFPNLLSSRDLRKLIISVTNVISGEELSAKLSYDQMEEFLRGVAEHSYPGRKGTIEQYKMLFLHMRNPCYLRYNLILETEEKPKKTLESSNLSVKTSHGVYFRPSSEKKIISYSPHRSQALMTKMNSVNNFLSPRVYNTFGFSLRLQEDSSRESSAQPSPKILNGKTYENLQESRKQGPTDDNQNVLLKVFNAFNVFKEKNHEIFRGTRRIAEKDLKIMIGIREKEVSKQVKLRFSFLRWKDLSLNYAFE